MSAIYQAHRVRYLKNCFCVSKITHHHFPGVVYNSKLRTRVHKQPFSSACKRLQVEEKQRSDVKQLEMNKFIFDVKQLKMNKYIKSIWHLIISDPLLDA